MMNHVSIILFLYVPLVFSWPFGLFKRQINDTRPSVTSATFSAPFPTLQPGPTSIQGPVHSTVPFTPTPFEPRNRSTDAFKYVNRRIYTNRTACSRLPIPTSGLRAIPIPQGNTTTPIQSLFVSNSSNTPNKASYISILDTDGTTLIYDFSTPGRVGISDVDGNALYIDSAGLHLSTSDCSLGVDIEISNFAKQVDDLAAQRLRNSSLLQSHPLLRKRIATQQFFVSADLTTQCGKPAIDVNPYVFVGPTMCARVPGSGSAHYDFLCSFPGANSGIAHCQNDVQSVIGFLTGGISGSVTNWGTLGEMTLEGFAGGAAKFYSSLLEDVTSASAAGLRTLLPKLVSRGLAWLAVLQVSVAVIEYANGKSVAELVCEDVYRAAPPLKVVLEAGTSSLRLTDLYPQYTHGKIPDLSGQYTIFSNAETSCQTCRNGATCDTYEPNCNGMGANCLCGKSTEGANFCFPDGLCEADKPCSSSDDCFGGKLCLVASCCGYAVCTDATSCLPRTNGAKRALGATWPDLGAGNNSISGLTRAGWVGSR
ncbi:hypothetical protein CC86DRAFT_460455 [Ophiobolus disseminans]|uniref:Uncharacterized protein n=1 Tax=Ophiobolus disseminans TaxID=1469910 RepID=A0A6A6ZG67_9PLEO|nr:hypothetical protein CC86DRAFT_460455 [Ophiobolus disseminans]